jgi:ribosomal protein S18 acetylase RimI-like enzyme
MYKILKIISVNEIENILLSCKDDLFSNLFKDPLKISAMAEKFSNHATFFSLYDDNLIGFVAFYDNDNISHIAYISMIVIKERKRGQGYGKLLLNKAIEQSLSTGMKHIKLQVNKDNINAIYFYRKMGFHECDNSSLKSFFMVKELI